MGSSSRELSVVSWLSYGVHPGPQKTVRRYPQLHPSVHFREAVEDCHIVDIAFDRHAVGRHTLVCRCMINFFQAQLIWTVWLSVCKRQHVMHGVAWRDRLDTWQQLRLCKTIIKWVLTIMTSVLIVTEDATQHIADLISSSHGLSIAGFSYIGWPLTPMPWDCRLATGWSIWFHITL